MVNYMLKIAADLENLTNLQPQGGCDDPDFVYSFKVKCGSCGEVSKKETCVSLNETVPLPKSKGTTNLVQKCKFCEREGTILMIPNRGSPLMLEMSESGKHCPLMLFDCRGFEPMGFHFGPGWKVESLVGTKFNEVDLSGGEFAEYDEKELRPTNCIESLWADIVNEKCRALVMDVKQFGISSIRNILFRLSRVAPNLKSQ